MRTEGTDNLLAAMRSAAVGRIVVESIAWRPNPAGAAAVDHLEQAVLGTGGVVLRYGQFYGPGTYFPGHLIPRGASRRPARQPRPRRHGHRRRPRPCLRHLHHHRLSTIGH
ncbi:MAG TPA: hypothetical protein VIA11_05775 [Acidimicrobiia bacterium]|jgi:hypothetical protein|nr:hypothetical protein [Acidimicrobiia bacterium]